MIPFRPVRMPQFQQPQLTYNGVSLEDAVKKLNAEYNHAPQVLPPPVQALGNYVSDVTSGRKFMQGLERLDTMGMNMLNIGPDGMPRPAPFDATMNVLSEFGGFGGMTVFHGSPHKFTKFKMDKIGTGEGAQAYGHGLYFAENPKVAGEYAKLQPIVDQTDGGFIKARSAFAEAKGNIKKANEWLDKQDEITANAKGFITDNGASDFADTARARKLLPTFGKGNLYNVDLPDEHIAKMLDWDKPLSEQPENVRKALAKLDDSFNPDRIVYEPEMYGKQIYDRIKAASGLNTGSAASEILKKQGIPGIKYLDQVSRAAGDGTRNFVVFDENIVKIIDQK